MDIERELVAYVFDTQFEDISRESLHIAKNIILTVLGTTIAGATSERCIELVESLGEEGGKEEATILIHGGRIPAHNAAFINSIMARALDFCDVMSPGLHLGSSAVPAAFAAAELRGGCSGEDTLTALVLGAEVAARLNLSESAYDGFDPTGVCGVFGATVVASKILGLSSAETWNALALAFNRSGGSFQSNIDGSLAVRAIQGWVSQNAITCARLAQLGVTGPKNFLQGTYGYFHLYGKDSFDPIAVAGELGKKSELQKVIFKKYPSCALTQASTDAILSLMEEEHLAIEEINQVDIAVHPYAYKLVGHQFQIGDNPKVNAQFSIQYCVANALLRKGSKLSHFEESYVKDPQISEFVQRISVRADPSLEERGHTATNMKVLISKGEIYNKQIDVPPGFPGNPLTQDEHEERFWDCIDFAGKPLQRERAERIMSLVGHLEQVEDVRVLIPLLLT
jgi:2-methylcitrate dehydratase PrpD